MKGFTVLISKRFYSDYFILPYRWNFSEHLCQYFFDGASVLELFSTYESIFPSGYDLNVTVGCVIFRLMFHFLDSTIFQFL